MMEEWPVRRLGLARVLLCVAAPALLVGLAGVGGCTDGAGTTVVTISPSPIGATVGQFVTVTVSVTVDGQPAANRTVGLTFSTDYIAVVLPASVTTNAQGTATTTLEGHNAGTTSLTATSGGVSSTAVTVVVTPPDAG
jgi:hypothetical protein